MADPAIELVGVDAAARDFRRWAEQVAPAVADGSHDFGARIVGRVAGEVPQVTGTLAGSVHWDATADGIDIAYGDVVYAGWIEFGGGNARPYIPEGRYLFPTAADAEDEWVAQAEEIANHAAERFPWSTPTR